MILWMPEYFKQFLIINKMKNKFLLLPVVLLSIYLVSFIEPVKHFVEYYNDQFVPSDLNSAVRQIDADGI